MEKNKNEELLHDIRFFLESAECDAASASGTDAEGLPFESIDDFDILPIDYDEQQAILLKRAEDLFILCQRYSRRSKKFQEAAAYLDKSIRSLASICITRIALVKNGRVLPQMNQLSTYKLFMMASFNYRKINAAIEDEMRDQLVFPMSLMGLLIRYHQTLERLRSTELKINKINTGKISISEQCKRSLTFSEHSPNRFYTAAQNEVPAFREAYSYPIDYDQLDQLKMDNGEWKIDQDAGCRMQEAGESGDQKSEIGSQLSAVSRQQAEESGSDHQELKIENGDQVSGFRCQESDQLKIENGEWKIDVSAELTSETNEAPVEVSVPEIVVPEEGSIMEESPVSEEPCIDITLRNGETVCVSVQYAKFMLMNPNMKNHPELAKALREFVGEALNERAGPIN